MILGDHKQGIEKTAHKHRQHRKKCIYNPLGNKAANHLNPEKLQRWSFSLILLKSCAADILCFLHS